MVAERVKSATAMTSPCGQRQWQAEPAEHEQAKGFGGVGGIWAVRNGGENSAGIRAALRIEQGLWLVANCCGLRPGVSHAWLQLQIVAILGLESWRGSAGAMAGAAKDWQRVGPRPPICRRSCAETAVKLRPPSLKGKWAIARLGAVSADVWSSSVRQAPRCGCGRSSVSRQVATCAASMWRKRVKGTRRLGDLGGRLAG